MRDFKCVYSCGLGRGGLWGGFPPSKAPAAAPPKPPPPRVRRAGAEKGRRPASAPGRAPCRRGVRRGQPARPRWGRGAWGRCGGVSGRGWEAQNEISGPARMAVTGLGNNIIDGVSAAAPEIVAEIEKYLGSDLVFYRAETPAALLDRQAQLWDPVLGFARETLGANFVTTQGVRFVTQPEAALAVARRAIPHAPWRLGALHVITTLTGSALIALALAADTLTLD